MFTRMGISVHLAVVAARVSDAAWRELYEKARHVALHWRPRPLSSGWRNIGAVRVAQYTPQFETTEGLHFVGDAESLTTAESHMFPVTLAHHSAPRGTWSRRPSSQADVVVTVAAELGERTSTDVQYLLGAKTQGLPYHVMIVALGLLVENALPGTAMVYGNLSIRDGEQARDGLAAILGEKFEPPVVMDVARLRSRLAASLDTDAVNAAVDRLGPHSTELYTIVGDLLAALCGQPSARVRHELEHVVATCRDPSQLHPGTQQLLRSLLDAIGSAIVRGEIRHRVEQLGASRAREAFARATQARYLRLSSMTWDAIETADLDELAFLAGATCFDTSRWETHHAVRAVLENRALRQLVGATSSERPPASPPQRHIDRGRDGPSSETRAAPRTDPSVRC
jgi:hypothetical protein